jgi:DNA-directed RNA polymerase specialized sigma24 family protein
VQDVLLRGLQRVHDGVRIDGDPIRYFFGIARNVVFEDRRAEVRAMVPMPPDLASAEDGIGPAEARICLHQVLNRLPDDDRHLLERYHLESRDALERDLGLTAEALRVRVHRLRRRVQREMWDLAATVPRVK